MFSIGSKTQISTNKTTKGFRPSYIVLSLLLLAQVLFSLVGTAAATYPGDNGDIIAGRQNQLVAFDPETFDEEVLRTFDTNQYISGASSNSTGRDINYLLQTSSDDVEFRIYNRQTESDRLVRTFNNLSSSDENGYYAPTSLSPISPNGNYVALTATNDEGNILQIARTSDGVIVANYEHAGGGLGWNSSGTQVLARDGNELSSNISWFDIDGSARTVAVPASALPSDVQVIPTSLSPDSQHVLYTTTSSTGTTVTVGEVKIDGTDNHLILSGTIGEDPSVPLGGFYSPDGQRFAYLRINTTTAAVTYVTRALNGGAETETASPAGQQFIDVYWSPALSTTPPDTAPPVVTGTPDRSPNANGWYKANVTINWQSVDPEPSSGTPTDPANTTANQEGKDITYTSGQSCDPANNCATGTLKLSIDKTAPSGAFTGSTLVLRLLGGNITGTAGDGLSGVDEVKITQGSHSWSNKTGGLTLACNTAKTSCTWAITTPSSLPLGINTYTITTTDLAGNTATSSKAYTVI